MLRHTLAWCGLLLRPVRCAGAQPAPATNVVLYEGARLIPGDGRAASTTAFLVERGTITKVGKRGEVTAPAGAGASISPGKTVMPALINAHGHPGFQRGLTYSADNFTRENIIDDLNRALYFGVVAVQSQGIEKGDVTYQIRADRKPASSAARACASPAAASARPMRGPAARPMRASRTKSRLKRVTASGPGARREESEPRQDLGRRSQRPRAAAAPGALSRRHRRGPQARPAGQRARVLPHGRRRARRRRHRRLAHLVRDKEMDDALVAAIVKRNVYVMPNLVAEWNTLSRASRLG